MKRLVVVLGALFAALGAVALELPTVFADHMVLQRGQHVPVWGTAVPGAKIDVQFAGQTKTAVAGEDGAWRVDLEPMPASAEPRTLQVSASSASQVKQLQCADVLVGEVWLCGGQSNMERTLLLLAGKPREPRYEPVAEYVRNELKTANDPLLRQFKVARQTSPYEEQALAAGEWTMAVPGSVAGLSATGYFFGRELRSALNVPVALLNCNWGGTRVEPWMPMNAFASDDALKTYYASELDALKQRTGKWDEAAAKANYERALEAWAAKADAAKAAGKSVPRKPRLQAHPDRDNKVPSTLYNGMLHSLVPYGMKGVIWYQGESNRNHYPEAYAARFSTLIDAWRANWGQDKLYFYWCQLATYTAPNEQPIGDEDGWVLVCDAQRRVLSKPDTGMAVLNDIGEAKDVHPHNKIDAGKRLSLWALNQAYGRNLEVSGPLYKSAEVKDGKMVITFDHVGAGLMVGHKHLLDPTVEVDEPLKRFQIRGSDGVWEWADAKILGKDQVAVWSPEIPDPVEVRYAWSANAEGANLYNKEGLPASMFKTK